MEAKTNEVNSSIIRVSNDKYDILARIAEDYDASIRDVADGLIAKGLKFSAFRAYATKGSAEAQQTIANTLKTATKPAAV